MANINERIVVNPTKHKKINKFKNLHDGINSTIIKIYNATTVFRGVSPSNIFLIFKKKYNYESLNDDQRKVIEAIDNGKQCILIQAGPGTGKTYTMIVMTLERLKMEKTTDVSIYKKDLLNDYKLSSFTYTLCSLSMKCLGLDYASYLAFEKYSCGNMSLFEYTMCLIYCTSRIMHCKEIKNMQLLLFDEYTVINRILLVGYLIACKHNKVQTILCGDKNQLQTISKNKHDSKSTSFILGSKFADEFVTLNINMRCADAEHNKLLTLLGTYASEEQLDYYQKVFICSKFLNNMLKTSDINNVYLATNHKTITEHVHKKVCEKEYDVEFYKIMVSAASKKLPNAIDTPGPIWIPYLVQKYENTHKVGKFLPYLPLIVGLEYYIEERSEMCIGTLVSYDKVAGHVFMKIPNKEEIIKIERKNASSVIFQAHLDELLLNGGGYIYGFPIYPANFITLHMCQGRTITRQIDINLVEASCHGAYVALSRAKSPETINHFTIKDELKYQISCIACFPHYIKNKVPTFDEIKNAIDDNTFKLYDIGNDNHLKKLLIAFYNSNSISERELIREAIQLLANKYKFIPLVEPENNNLHDSNILQLLQYTNIIEKAAIMEYPDSLVWFFEIGKHLDLLWDSNAGNNYDAICNMFCIQNYRISNTKDYILQYSTIGEYDVNLTISQENGICRNTTAMLKILYDKIVSNEPITIDFLVYLANNYKSTPVSIEETIINYKRSVPLPQLVFESSNKKSKH